MLRAYQAPGDLLRLLRDTLDPLAVWIERQGVNEISGAADSWQDQQRAIRCTAASAGNRPVVAADSANFRSTKVVQCANTGSKCLVSGTLATPLLPAGSFPYFLTVFRTRGIPDGRAWAHANVAAAQEQATLLSDPSITVYEFYTRNASVFTSQVVAQTPITQHVSELFWNAADGKRTYAINGAADVVQAVGVAGGTKAAIDVVGLGTIAPTVGQVTNTSLVLHVVCRAAPIASRRTVAVQACRAHFGI